MALGYPTCACSSSDPPSPFPAALPLCLALHHAQVERAVALGYDLRGVMYWSLVDNFEWAEGFAMRVRLGAVGCRVWVDRPQVCALGAETLSSHPL